MVFEVQLNFEQFIIRPLTVHTVVKGSRNVSYSQGPPGRGGEAARARPSLS